MSENQQMMYDRSAYIVRVRFVGGPKHGLVLEMRSNEMTPGKLTRCMDNHLYVSESGWSPGMECVDIEYDNGPLEACPFCGELPDVYADPMTGKWIVTCRGADCPTMWSTIPQQTRDEAVQVANKRDEYGWRRRHD